VKETTVTDLPPPAKPAGMYLPAVVHDGVAYSAGAVPFVDGVLAMSGRVGDDLDIDAARECARIAARNALSAVAGAAGGIENVERLLRVGVFVQCAADFKQTARVADGATEALMEILGDGGRCARTAVGVYSLPLDAPVEVELVAALHRR
jgi:enamine deaminase RidA (YjgF/YER057c/UK114 family)